MKNINEIDSANIADLIDQLGIALTGHDVAVLTGFSIGRQTAGALQNATSQLELVVALTEGLMELSEVSPDYKHACCVGFARGLLPSLRTGVSE